MDKVSLFINECNKTQQLWKVRPISHFVSNIVFGCKLNYCITCNPYQSHSLVIFANCCIEKKYNQDGWGKNIHDGDHQESKDDLFLEMEFNICPFLQLIRSFNTNIQVVILGSSNTESKAVSIVYFV